MTTMKTTRRLLLLLPAVALLNACGYNRIQELEERVNQQLQDELAETENRINVARRDYNESVQTYNSFIRQFPQVITAKVTGAERREPFEAPEGANTAPQVQFD